MQTINSNTWNNLIVCKQMSSGSFKNVTYKLFVYKLYIYIYIYFIIDSKRERNILKWVGPWRDLYFFKGFIHLFCSYIHVCFQLASFFREHVWHKASLIGYAMKLKLICVGILNGFQLVMGFYGGHSSHFFRMCSP